MNPGVPLNWYAVLLVVAAASSWALTFPARRLAVLIGYVAQPDDRKVHQRVTPESGGVAMFLAMLVTFAVAASVPALGVLFRASPEPTIPSGICLLKCSLSVLTPRPVHAAITYKVMTALISVMIVDARTDRKFATEKNGPIGAPRLVCI